MIPQTFLESNLKLFLSQIVIHLNNVTFDWYFVSTENMMAGHHVVVYSSGYVNCNPKQQ